jgi:hypothetical protein
MAYECLIHWVKVSWKVPYPGSYHGYEEEEGVSKITPHHVVIVDLDA